MVDDAAVRVALNWHTPPRTDATVGRRTASAAPNLIIPDNNAAGVSSTVTFDPGLRIEQAEVRFTLRHDWYPDLQMVLTAPTGGPKACSSTIRRGTREARRSRRP